MKSKVGEGTSFSFHLAFEIAPNATPLIKENMVDHNNDLNHLKILVAEDNAINQMIVKKILTDWHATVECAENGLIAYEKIQSGCFDLVLMDIQMPEMDGYTAANKIRNELRQPLSSIPIIAMTAHAAPTESIRLSG